jgi:hypothetical protein
MKRTWLRALAGLFTWVLLAGLGTLAPTPSYAATSCGGAGQRACCVTERPGGVFGDPCTSGLHEVAGCTGDCKCGGVNPFGVSSIGHCEGITDCGGAGQRACCVAERPGRPCNPDALEFAGCSGNCVCGGPNPGYLLNSISHCFGIAACGGPGQRACCVTEQPGRPCNPGSVEIGGCSGNCVCGGPAPNPNGFLKSISRCVAVTPCGGAGQRACCVTERAGGIHGLPCNSGLIVVGSCSGDCRCGGANPGGVLNSIEHCAPPPVTPQQSVTGGPSSGAQQAAPPMEQNVGGAGGPSAGPKGAGGAPKGASTTNQGAGGAQQGAPTASCQSALAALNAANQAVQQLCGPAGGAQKGAPTTNQNVGGPGGLPAQNMGGPGGLPAKSGSPTGLQRPISPPAAPGSLQRPITR